MTPPPSYLPRKFCQWDDRMQAYGFIHGLHQSYPRFWIEGKRCKSPAQVCEWLYHLSQQVWFSADHCEQFMRATRERGAWEFGKRNLDVIQIT